MCDQEDGAIRIRSHRQAAGRFMTHDQPFGLQFESRQIPPLNGRLAPQSEHQFLATTCETEGIVVGRNLASELVRGNVIHQQ